MSHGEHLLSPIVPGEDGSRAALCPVCRTAEALPSVGAWLNVRCRTCGTEFVATDGSPPPAVLPPPPRRSPIAPTVPLEPLPLSGFPRGFTSDVRTDDEGRMWVTCPQCRGAEILFPPGAVTLRCPACHNTFLVGLRLDAPPEPPEPLELPVPPPPVYNPDGRFWDRCPTCGSSPLTPGRLGAAFVQTCAACGQQVVVSEGPYPPRPPALPAPPSVWERIRRWFGGG